MTDEITITHGAISITLPAETWVKLGTRYNEIAGRPIEETITGQLIHQLNELGEAWKIKYVPADEIPYDNGWWNEHWIVEIYTEKDIRACSEKSLYEALLKALNKVQ